MNKLLKLAIRFDEAAKLYSNGGDVINMFTRKKINTDTEEPSEEPDEKFDLERELQKAEKSPFAQLARKHKEKGMKGVKKEIQTKSVGNKLEKLRKITQDRINITTLQNNINIVNEYDDEQLRHYIFKTDEKKWMEKPTFFYAVFIVAKKRWKSDESF